MLNRINVYFNRLNHFLYRIKKTRNCPSAHMVNRTFTQTLDKMYKLERCFSSKKFMYVIPLGVTNKKMAIARKPRTPKSH